MAKNHPTIILVLRPNEIGGPIVRAFGRLLLLSALVAGLSVPATHAQPEAKYEIELYFENEPSVVPDSLDGEAIWEKWTNSWINANVEPNGFVATIQSNNAGCLVETLDNNFSDNFGQQCGDAPCAFAQTWGIFAGASECGQPSWGPSDLALANESLSNEDWSSWWTTAMFGNSRFNGGGPEGVLWGGSETNNIYQDFLTGGREDAAAYLWRKEAPVVSEVGGATKPWNNGAGWVVVSVAGDGKENEPDSPASPKRYDIDFEMVAGGMEETVGPVPSHSFKGGSVDEFEGFLEEVAGVIEANTNVMLYVDGPSGLAIDYPETLGWPGVKTIDEAFAMEIDYGPGPFGVIWAIIFQTNSPPQAWIEIQLEVGSTWDWAASMNERLLECSYDPESGRVICWIPAYRAYLGNNVLKLWPEAPQDSGDSTENIAVTEASSLEISSLKFHTGPLDTLETDIRQRPAQSAAFYDPDRNGEGIFVELLENGKAVIYVFTYAGDGSGQSWMVGLGDQVGRGVVITELFMPTGPSFGSDYDPSDLVMNPFGGLAFGFPSCGSNDYSGVLAIPPGEMQGFNELLLSPDYVQITEIVDCQTGESSEYAGYSGSWFDPSHNGEGIILQVLKDGTVLAQWFTFDKEGNQMWVQGTGTIVDGVLVIDELYTTSGTAYGTGFNPEDVTRNTWGTLRMEFTSCDTAVVNYESSAGFGSGTLNMTRITNLMGIPCEEGSD